MRNDICGLCLFEFLTYNAYTFFILLFLDLMFYNKYKLRYIVVEKKDTKHSFICS